MLDKELLEKVERVAKAKEEVIAHVNKQIEEFMAVMSKFKVSNYECYEYDFSNTIKDIPIKEVKTTKPFLKKLDKLGITIEDGKFLENEIETLEWRKTWYGDSKKEPVLVVTTQKREYFTFTKDGEEGYIDIRCHNWYPVRVDTKSNEEWNTKLKIKIVPHLNKLLEVVVKEVEQLTGKSHA